VKKFRKKPVVIEASRFMGVISFREMQADWGDEFSKVASITTTNKLIIQTLEGDMIVRFGDYVIKGVKGEFYPCKPDIFEQTYESA